MGGLKVPKIKNLNRSQKIVKFMLTFLYQISMLTSGSVNNLSKNCHNWIGWVSDGAIDVVGDDGVSKHGKEVLASDSVVGLDDVGFAELWVDIAGVSCEHVSKFSSFSFDIAELN